MFRTGRILRSFSTLPVARRSRRVVAQHPRRLLGGTVRHRRRPAHRSDASSSTSSVVREEDVLVLTPTAFQAQASQLLAKLDAALQPLVPLNAPHMFVTRGEHNTMIDDDEEEEEEEQDEDTVQGEYLLVDCGPVHGQYQIQIDTAQQMLIFVSPISGQRIYHYQHNKEGGGQWCCAEDGHNFEGLLVRDLIRHVQGVPQL